MRLPLWRGALVLNYHRLFDGRPSLFHPGLFSATSDRLERQLVLIKRHFDVISADELIRTYDSPGRKVVITFDDGYRDNYEIAFPVLRRHGVPATFFLTTGFLDHPRVPWWDELAWMVHRSERDSIDGSAWFSGALAFEGTRQSAIDALNAVYKALPATRTEDFLDFCADATGSGRCDPDAGSDLWMTWQMAADMRDAGMSIGGHTQSHPVLARLDRERQEKEIAECARRLDEQLGVTMRLFSYPVGFRDSFDTFTRECLRRHGVQAAFSLYGGYVRPGRVDPYDLPRASVGLGTGQREFASMLAMPWVFARW